jgi:hypothetical protein
VLVCCFLGWDLPVSISFDLPEATSAVATEKHLRHIAIGHAALRSTEAVAQEDESFGLTRARVVSNCEPLPVVSTNVIFHCNRILLLDHPSLLLVAILKSAPSLEYAFGFRLRKQLTQSGDADSPCLSCLMTTTRFVAKGPTFRRRASKGASTVGGRNDEGISERCRT